MRGAKVVQAVVSVLALVAFTSGYLIVVRPEERSDQELHMQIEQYEYDETKVAPLLVGLLATKLTPAERRLEASVVVVPLSSDKLPVFVDGAGRPVVQDGEIRPEFADAKLRISLVNWYVGEPATIFYPLEHVFDSDGPADARQISASIPADVDPSRFPNDTYRVDLAVSAFLPAGLTAVPKRHDPADPTVKTVPANQTLPVVYAVANDHRLGHWTLDTDPVLADNLAEDRTSRVFPHLIKAEFSRGWPSWMFIYAISLMPAVVGLSFFLRTRRRGAGAPDTSAAMELAAALLALIALRQVFVPTDIVGITWLDVVLGVQLLGVCGLMAVSYVATPPAPAPTPPKPRPRRRRMTPRLPDGAIRQRP